MTADLEILEKMKKMVLEYEVEECKKQEIEIGEILKAPGLL